MVLASAATGGPVTITTGPYSEPPTVAVRYREATGVNPTTWGPDAGDTPALSADGRAVLLPLPVELKNCPGVYRLQAMVRTAAGAEVARDECLVLVERGLWTTTGDVPATDAGPPTVAEVRTALRDHPGANRLLGDYAWDAAEIGTAMVQAVRAYNSEFPPLPQGLTTITFPILWRQDWINGIISYLYETATEYHRRGHLPYAAGGLKVDDLAKEKDYLAAAKEYRDRFMRFVRLARATQNYAQGWGSVAGGLYGGGIR